MARRPPQAPDTEPSSAFGTSSTEIDLDTNHWLMQRARRNAKSWREPNLSHYDHIVVSTSGGKDSQAALEYTYQAARKQGVLDRLTVVHCDLGRVEWQGTRDLVERQVEKYGLDLTVVKRPGNDLLDQVLKERKKWPAYGMAQFCTSDHKTSQVAKVVTGLTEETRKAEGYSARSKGRVVRVLQVLGLRAQESQHRAELHPMMAHTLPPGSWEPVDPKDIPRYPPTKQEITKAAKEGREPLGKPMYYDSYDKTEPNTIREEWQWLPVFDWTEDQVWSLIRRRRLEYHRAYDLGMSRFSCAFCICARRADLLIAARHNKELLRQYVKVERKIGFTFKHGWPIERLWDEVYPGERV
jgi:3'-phosphoadenosine 5'-phosphosulfate sulfotransferase (PAPS reductase)/FAD synthetase